MDWLDSFEQEVKTAQQTEPVVSSIAPAQLQPEIQKEPPVSADGQNGDWLDAFDTQVQEAQKVLEVSDEKGKTFETWFDEKYLGTKEFLEASGESMVQLGYGAFSFLPSYGLGFATQINEKLKNLLRQDRIEETVRRGGFPVSPQATDLARKPMMQLFEEAKIKSPKQIRELADKASGFFAEVMGEPVTKGGKKVVGKAGELMDWLFHYPHVADEKLSKAGYPNLGYLTGFAGEMLLLKGFHGAAKKGKKVSKNIISRYIKTVEDVKDIKTPAQLKAVSSQVDKILDQLGITEEQRIIATDKTFRAQKDVGSWVEERARVKREVELTKEVPSAKEIRTEVKAPGVKEEKLVRGTEEEIRLRDAEKDWLEAKEEIVVEKHKPEVVLEKPSVRKLNIEKVKDTKLVDLEGQPREVYHSTKKEFKEFDNKMMGTATDAGYYGKGFYFSTAPSSSYGKNTVSAYLDIKKPLRDVNRIFEEIASELYPRVKDLSSKQIDTIESKMTDRAKAQGYDGIIAGPEFVVFDANQIHINKIDIPKPSVQKPNIEAEYGKRVAGEISDGIKVAEDMGVFETIRSGIEAKKKVGEIMKEIKKERYYEEDLKDFGYNEKDLRSAVRAVKVREFGDVKIAKEIKAKLEKEVTKAPKDIKRVIGKGKTKLEYILEGKDIKEPAIINIIVAEHLQKTGVGTKMFDEFLTQITKKGYKRFHNATDITHEGLQFLQKQEKLGKIKEIKVTEPEPDYYIREYEITERVDVERGRPAGVKADLKKYEQPSRVKEELLERKIRREAEMAPLKTAEGKIVGSKVLAMRLAKSRGMIGEVVRTPEGKGWYVKKTKEMKAKETEATKKFWDSMLKEEGMEVLEPETGAVRGTVDILKSERGSVVIQPETIKKLRSAVKHRKIKEADLVAEMQRRKVPNSQILRAFPNAFKKTAVEGTSKWLGRRDDPGDFLPRRITKRKTGKMKYARLAPAVTRGDAHVVSTFTKDLPRPIFGEKVRAMATSEGLFTQLGKAMKNTFYYVMRAAAKSENDFVTALVKESNVMKKTFSLGTRQFHADRIGKYEIAQQKDGLARLKTQGVKNIPTKLTPKELVVYDAMQKVYKSLFIEINKARRAAGQQLFPPVENYSPWFHDMVQILKYEKMDILADIGKINQAMTQLREIPSQIEKVSRAPGMAGHEKFRAGPETPGFLHLNAFDNFNAYAKLAGKAIHIGPTTAYLHELLLPRFKLAENAPNTWRFISDWLDYQKGHEPIMFIENPVTRRRMRELSSNVAVSYITYNWGSALNQASSINNTIARIGLPRTIEGFVKTLNPAERKRAAAKSDVLTVRSPETVLMGAGRPYPLLPGKIGRSISDATRRIKTIGSSGLMLSDSLVAKASWLGAEAKARRIYKTSKTYKEMATAKRFKALEKFSKEYADDVVEQAQGSAARAARAPFQRTAEGAAMSTLQTFVIANFDFLTRQVLGIKNPDITNIQRVQRLTRYVASTASIAYAFDFMGMRSPVPDPVTAAGKEAEKLGYVTDMEEYTKISKAVAMELLEYVPIYGGKFKYGSEFGGVLINELVKLGTGDATAIPRLLGIPGFQQFLKSYRAAKRGGTDIDIIFGRYVEKPRNGRVRRSQRSR